ncbi:hypothetical protein [Marinobacter salexigens]|uniref:hypothetical protein n=1 Tax=Marinobacter salexigens TaxID=1925763 RepID=UPI000C291AD2|nr:hypothetical protein [Marinobacter salexigens]
MKKTFAITVLAFLFSASSAVLSQEILDGEQIAKLLVGNTLQADYQEGGECRRTFYEYFSEDGKIYGQEKRAQQASGYTRYLGTWEVKDGEFCTNVGYGHRGGCSVFEKVGDAAYMRQFDGFAIDRVKIHEGRHRPCM